MYFTLRQPILFLIKNKCRHFSLKSSSLSQWKPLVFSGIQPTGDVHLGNYLGALHHWVKIQDQVEQCTFCIVDLHSITLSQNPQVLKKTIYEMTATLLACGINPEKSTLFLQSTVPQHSELCWQLACLTTMARLSHLPQFKEKSASLKDIPLGLYIYPVLQAADILVHKATLVPVGEDQLQHLQMAQQLVKTFNYKYGITFPTPKALLTDECSRLKSLRDPTKKMSKSDPDPRSRILLRDTPEEIKSKIKKAITDFTSEVSYNPVERPGVSNLIEIHSIMSRKKIDEICEESKHLDTGKYKYVVAESVAQYLAPIREKMNDLLAKPEYLRQVLEFGQQKAIKSAMLTLSEVQDKVGTTLNIQTEKVRVKL